MRIRLERQRLVVEELQRRTARKDRQRIETACC
jgi:hypothetical protein